MPKDTDRRQQEALENRAYFESLIEQKKVEDITLDIFYKPHTITLLLIIVGAIFTFSIQRESHGWKDDLVFGSVVTGITFLLVSVLIMPNGPFTRPHPAIWRVVFGASLIYFHIMCCVSFMSLDDSRSILIHIYPSLANMTHSDILNKEYAVNCSIVTWERLYSHMDEFAVAHFLGWTVKAILLRHFILTWFMSVNWEITEMFFCHAMPNFCECWWDSVILDIILCNGLGIIVGWCICRWLEMRNYHWEGIRSIQGTTGKLKRAVLQFTPRYWYPTRWFDNDSTIQRGIMLSMLMVVFQLVELNTFFLKHIFIVKPSHPLTLGRLALITLTSAPVIRQYYLYVTDPRVERLGSQSWIFIGTVAVEMIICLKFGREILEKTMYSYLIFWFTWVILCSVIALLVCLFFAHRCQYHIEGRFHTMKEDGHKKQL